MMKKLKHLLLSLFIIPLGVSLTSCGPEPEDEHLRIEPNEITLNVGATKIITAITDPAGQLVSWESENEDIATVNRIGKVTAVSVGSTRISATLGNEVKYCAVTVKQSSIVVDELVDLTITISGGEIDYPTYQLNPTMDEQPISCTYESDDTSIASVDTNGLITAVGVGSANITVAFGSVSANVVVNVSGPTGYYKITSAQASEVVANPGIWYMHTAGSASNVITYHIEDYAHLEINATGANQTFLRYQVPDFSAGEYYQFTTKVTVNKDCYLRISCGSVTDLIQLSQGENDIGVYGRELVTSNCLGFLFLNSTSSTDYAKSITADIKDFIAAPSINISTKTLNLSIDGTTTGQIIVASEGTFEYESENTAVAIVDSTGLVTAVGDGTTKVWVSSGEAKGYVTVTVSGKRIVLSDSEIIIKQGNNKTVTVDTSESRGIDFDNVSWASDNESIATVNEGVITAHSVGTTNITASEGGVSASVSVIIYDDTSKISDTLPNFPHKKTSEMADATPGWYKLNYYCDSIVMNNGVITLTNDTKIFKDVQQIRYLPDDGNGGTYHGRYYVVYTVTSGMHDSSGASIAMTCQSQGNGDTTYQSNLITLNLGDSETVSHMVPAASDNMGFLVFKLKYLNGYGTITFSDIYIVKVN